MSFFLGIVIINGCTVQKKRGEVGTLGKIYHNTTSLYNGYFNADVIMQESLVTLESQHQDNFNRILPLYPYMAATNPKVVSESLDNAIEKVSIVATIHDPGQWVDDCYVLLGQAQFMKQDYETAEKTFEFFVDEFDPLNKRKSRLKKKTTKKKSKTRTSTRRPTKKKAPKKKKSKTPKKKKTKKPSSKKKKPGTKKRAKPGTKKRPPKETTTSKTNDAASEKKVTTTEKKENSATRNTKEEEKTNPPNSDPKKVVSSAEKKGMFGHEPVYQEGMLWLAKTYILRERYSMAQYYLDKVSGDSNTPEDVQRQIPVVKAFYHINKKENQEAIQALESAIGLSKNKYDKARYTFIIAQLHQADGRQDKAFVAYNQVIKMHPEYEMEFNAQLNLCKAAWASGQESAKSTMNRLEKMAKEEKNYDYRDQIYYTMGTIHLRLKERDLAITDFRKSNSYNIGNTAQSAETYYALASFFYEEEEYDNAKFHYDSTLINLAKNDDRYDDVKRKSENLKDIAVNISVIKLQDSLLRVADMSPEQQREIAASIKKKQELAASPKSPKGGGLQNAIAVSAGPGAAVGAKKSSFFAYDINKVRRGQNEFRKKWGSRSLEDDWRRSNKPSSAITENTSTEEIARRMTDDEVKQLLGGVPFNDQQKAVSKQKIEEAYFGLGKLYRSKLEQYTKSVNSLDELFRRNGDTEFKLESYYYLYLSHTDLGNTQQARAYLEKLKAEFPDSKYTLSLTDPNYAAEQLNEAKKDERTYDRAYALFESGQFQESFDILTVLAAKKDIKIKGLQAKADLLLAMCEGNLNGQDAYVTKLNYVVKKHPNTPEQARAREILRFVKGDNQAFDPILYTEGSENFTLEPEKLHYVLVILYSKSSKDMTKSKIDVSAFNQKNFKNDKLKISSIFLNKEEGSQIILVRKFRNKEIAMTYYTKVNENIEDYIKSNVEYDLFAVTQKSYREIVKQKTVNSYREFFENNYLSGSN